MFVFEKQLHKIELVVGETDRAWMEIFYCILYTTYTGVEDCLSSPDFVCALVYFRRLNWSCVWLFKDKLNIFNMLRKFPFIKFDGIFRIL